KEGYDVHEEKLWQSWGGVTLAGGSSRRDLNLGYVHIQGERLATRYRDVTGNTVDPELALARDGVRALIPSNNAEFRGEVFSAPRNGAAHASRDLGDADLGQAVLKVHYRTRGAPVDDHYTIEASLDGTFTDPGSTSSTWNTILPLVGSSGNDGAEW